MRRLYSSGWRLRAPRLLCVGLAVCLSSCAQPYYSITFFNVGDVDVAVESFVWGEKTFPGDSIAPDIPLRASAKPTAQFHVAGPWNIPEKANITWTYGGGPKIHAEIAVRDALDNPNSFRNVFVIEFDRAHVKIFLIPRALGEQFDKKLIGEGDGVPMPGN